VFAKDGFYKTTVSAIAKEAGVADGTIYLYFKNKDDILRQFFSYLAVHIFERFQEAVSKGDTAVEKLSHLIDRHLQECQDYKDFARVFQTEARQNRKLIENEIKRISRTYLELLESIIEQGQQEGSIRKDIPVGLSARLVLSALDGVINNWVLGGCKYDMTTITQQLVDLLVHGLGNNSFRLSDDF
jgi:TetR/AcrR family transcriptional regulator, fatty acid metabolism regulator protein